MDPIKRETKSANYEDRAATLLTNYLRFCEAVNDFQFNALDMEVVIDRLKRDLEQGISRNSDLGLFHTETQFHTAIASIVDMFRDQIGRNVKQLARLGGWHDSLGTAWIMHRIPTLGKVPSLGDSAPGWNSLMSSAMGNTNGDEAKQLCASLVDPSCYCEPLVRLLRRDIGQSIHEINPESPTAQWLAARAVESPRPVNQLEFLEQACDAQAASFNLDYRKTQAIAAYDKFRATFGTHPDLPPDIPCGENIGCIEAAYIHGHPLAVRMARGGYYLLETFQHHGLGLEDFRWSPTAADAAVSNGPLTDDGRRVVCAELAELKLALQFCRRRFARDLKLVNE